MKFASATPPPRVDDLLRKTKLMCFGRYAVQVPLETEQVFGYQTIDGGFKAFEASADSGPEKILDAQWRDALRTDPQSEKITEILEGPSPNAKHIWFHDGSLSKEEDLRVLSGAIAVGGRIYLFEEMVSRTEGTTAQLLMSNMTALMRGMREWDGVEVPRQPGVCIRGAFIHEPTQRFQEIMSSGFFFPSLPDVRFSVMSNKNASVEGDNGKGLLQRVDEARREQLFYPYTFLRHGKRTLHGLWDGEEVLARRSDGALQFDWELVGEPRNVARPPWFEVGLRTRVENDKVGAARVASLSEDEALRLWDRLLEGLRFRVAVPGCTPESVALR